MKQSKYLRRPFVVEDEAGFLLPLSAFCWQELPSGW